MFTCESCFRAVGPRIAAIFKVVGKRERTYTNQRYGEVIISKGWEIVKEIKLYAHCASKT